MVGFEANDQVMVKEALDDFLPELATVTRPTSSKTKGDKVLGAATSVGTNVKARVIPISSSVIERMKMFPEAILEQAEYVITLQTGLVYKDADLVTIGSNVYRLLVVRYDKGSWNPVVRALAVANE